MKKNIITIALFSLISLSTSPTQPNILRPVKLEERSALIRILDYAGVSEHIQKQAKKNAPRASSHRAKHSPVAIPSSIKELRNHTVNQPQEKYNFDKEWEAYINRPRNPMPNPNKTPFRP